MAANALSIHQLSKVYTNGVVALKGIDLEVAEGDFFALLGPNGAGKSTTIGVVSSLVLKTGGKVLIFGRDIDSDFARARRDIGVMPQEFNFNNFERALHIVVTQAGYYGVPARLAHQRAEKYLKMLGLWEQRQTRAIELSGGMKRRLMIVRALLHEPRLLILDEPTAGVDIEFRHSLWDFLRQINRDGTTIILTTHYLEEAESLCRNVAIIDHGEIVHHGAMRDLASMLEQQLFILETVEALTVVPELPDYHPQLIDPHTVQLQLSRNNSLNQLFAQCNALDLEVGSIRPKSNRLEELFLSLTSKEAAR